MISRQREIRHGMKGCAFRRTEWSGELDVVHGHERIRDEPQGVCYGLWGRFKNSDEFDGRICFGAADATEPGAISAPPTSPQGPRGGGPPSAALRAR